MTTLIPKFDFKNGGSTPTGAINRAINFKLAEIVSVTDFGATGDGTTNDTTAIQNALNSLTLGGTLYFPPGTYLTNTLTIPNTSEKAIKLIGAGSWAVLGTTGYGATILKSAAAEPLLTIPSSVDGTAIENLYFFGNSIGTIGINGQAGKITVESCQTIGFTTAGISMTGGLCAILNCNSTGNGGDGLRMASDGRVFGSYLSANQGYGIINTGTNLGGTLIANNEIAFNTKGGLYVDGSTVATGNLFISGCYIEGNGSTATAGQTVHQCYFYGGSGRTLRNVKMENNYISNFFTTNGVLGNALHFENCVDIELANMTFLGSGGNNTTEGNGIYFKNVARATITNLLFRENNISAINIDSTSDSFTISNINIFDIATASTSTANSYGLVCKATNSLITNVLVVDARSPSYSRGIDTSSTVVSYKYYGTLANPNTITTGLYTDGPYFLGQNIWLYNSYFLPQTQPSAPSEGSTYYDATTKKLYCWNGTTWNALF